MPPWFFLRATGYALAMYERSAVVPVQLSCAGTADAVTACELRHSLRSWLRELPQAAPVSEDIILGVNEALANCVEHASRAAKIGTMSLQAAYDPAAKTIRICVS